MLQDDRKIDRVEYVDTRQVTNRQSTRQELGCMRKAVPSDRVKDEAPTSWVFDRNNVDRNINIPWLLSEDSCFAVPKSVIWMCISSLSKIFSGFRSLKVEK